MQYLEATIKLAGRRKAAAAAAALLAAFLLAACEVLPTDPADPSEQALPPADRVTVKPAFAELYTGDAIQLTLELTDEDGRVLVVRQASWSSSNREIAEVSSSGLVTALGTGRVLITARSGEDLSTAQIRVLRQGGGDGGDEEDELELLE